MSKVGVTLDDSQVETVFKALTSKNQKKALKQGIRKSAQILVKRTKQLLKQNVKNVTKPSRFKDHKKMINGVKFAFDRDKNKNMEGKVHIMGEFRLKFFEVGTADRYQGMKRRKGLMGFVRRLIKGAKHKRYTGRIKPIYFFKKAKSDTEQQVFSSLNENIKESITKAILKGKKK